MPSPSTAPMPPELLSLDDRVSASSAAVCAETVSVCLRAFPAGVEAIVLTGSLARNEGTWLSSAGKTELIGDAEFIVVLRPEAKIPPAAVEAALCREAEAALLRSGLAVHVSLGVVHSGFLRRLASHMFAFELRACGLVVWGDPRILDLVPAFAASKISLEDAWRTLCNRSIEALEALAAAGPSHSAVPREVFYKVVKLDLDMATSLLLFAGVYEAGYARRSARLAALASGDAPSGLPFSLPEFSRRVAACTAWKLAPDAAFERAASWEWCLESLRYAAALWRWELARLAEAPAAAPARSPMAAWMRRQPLAARLRGWLSLWRDCGWLRGLASFPRWARLALAASPRYWIYAPLGDLLSAAAGDVPEDTLRRSRGPLPLAPRFAPRRADGWRSLAATLAFEYHKFLEHTRS